MTGREGVPGRARGLRRATEGKQGGQKGRETGGEDSGGVVVVVLSSLCLLSIFLSLLQKALVFS